MGTGTNPVVVGDATLDEASGTWTITSGGSDIWDPSDHFHFVYQPMSGDGLGYGLVGMSVVGRCAEVRRDVVPAPLLDARDGDRDRAPRAHEHAHARGARQAGRRLPEAALVCNFPRPGELMTHDEVETFFHEFGHLLGLPDRRTGGDESARDVGERRMLVRGRHLACSVEQRSRRRFPVAAVGHAGERVLLISLDA